MAFTLPLQKMFNLRRFIWKGSFFKDKALLRWPIHWKDDVGGPFKIATPIEVQVMEINAALRAWRGNRGPLTGGVTWTWGEDDEGPYQYTNMDVWCEACRKRNDIWGYHYRKPGELVCNLWCWLEEECRHMRRLERVRWSEAIRPLYDLELFCHGFAI